jgi:hypothetical protein
MADPGALPQMCVGQAPTARAHFAEPKMFLPAILTVRRHRLPVATCKRAIVIPDIAHASIDIGEGGPLFPAVGNAADGGQGAVFHSYVGAACAIGSLRHRLGMGGLQEHRAGDQERGKRTVRDLQADSNMPALRTAKMVRAKKGWARSSQSESNSHQDLQSVHRNQDSYCDMALPSLVVKLRTSDGLYLYRLFL